jgi:hypothetical protein
VLLLELGEQLGGNALTGSQQTYDRGVDAGVARSNPQSCAQAVRCRDLDVRRSLEAGPHAGADMGQPLRIDFHLQAVEMTQAAARRHAGGIAPALTRGGVEPARLQCSGQGLPCAVEQLAQRGLPVTSRLRVECRAPPCQRHFVVAPGVHYRLMHARPGLDSGPAHDVGRLRRGFVAQTPGARFLLAPQPAQQRRGLCLEQAFDVVHQSIPSALRTVCARSGGAPRPRTSAMTANSGESAARACSSSTAGT